MEKKLWQHAIEKNQRTLDSIISTYEYSKKEHWYNVLANSPLLNGRQAKIWYEENHFHFHIAIVDDNVKPADLELIMKAKNLLLIFQNSSFEWKCDFDSVDSLSSSIQPTQGYTIIEGKLKHLKSNEKNDDKQLYTAIIQCPDENFLGSHFPAYNLKVGEITYGMRLIELSIIGQPLHFYIYGKENLKEKFLFVESIDQIEYEKFSCIINEVLLCIAYLTGISVGKEIFTLVNHPNESYKAYPYCHSIYKENIQSNKYGTILKLDDGITEHSTIFYKNGLEFLKTIIEKCILSTQYRRAILLLIKANSEEDYIKTTIYSVALESMCKLMYEKKPINPIPEKKLASQIRDDLKKIINHHAKDLQEESIAKLNNYVNNINRPSNSDMLTKPFVENNIKLNELDLQAINHRNDFLHGRLPYDSGTHELSIIALRLLYCVSCLILKYSGYIGGLNYYSFHYQHYNNLKKEGNPYYLI
ncbi:hypothetical protein F0919_00735 [Taibaiella lutea]|uniref:ApeA N-terminal domain-containing protein n=1 Tax=Taibaiella lutea TaxID=2608001 RepID=A0A5M6CM71_9BACT|nr:hypothetical protein [Taibaiella lutea]KAA5536224.1 hypothetical protein F0919_00735 [Taibaiella lutea]